LLLIAVAALALPAAGVAGHDTDTQPDTFHLGVDNTHNLGTGLSGASASNLFAVTNTSTTGGVAVRGVASAATGSSIGVLGQTNASGDTARGVVGYLANTSPGLVSAGVQGRTLSMNANGPGVRGEHIYPDGTSPGVLGVTDSTDPSAHGVRGEVGAASTAQGSAGVYGVQLNTNGNFQFNAGVHGRHDGGGIGVLGESANGIGALGVGTTVGVAGIHPTGGLAGYFAGNVLVTGTLVKGAGAFRIDHPLDPAHKYLQHSFVESPDMKNIYDGVVTTDRRGFATVTLPHYFDALNRDFRYQLTLLGKAAWGAQAVVWQKIHLNRFVIRSKPRVEVSWQVTGIRKDAYANANRIQPELAKPAADQGRYLHPRLYGKSRAFAVGPAGAIARH